MNAIDPSTKKNEPEYWREIVTVKTRTDIGRTGYVLPAMFFSSCGSATAIATLAYNDFFEALYQGNNTTATTSTAQKPTIACRNYKLDIDKGTITP